MRANNTLPPTYTEQWEVNSSLFSNKTFFYTIWRSLSLNDLNKLKQLNYLETAGRSIIMHVHSHFLKFQFSRGNKRDNKLFAVHWVPLNLNTDNVINQLMRSKIDKFQITLS